MYAYTDPQGISYPAYGQGAGGSVASGIQYPAYNSSGYNNSYNQAVNDYASAALSYGYSAPAPAPSASQYSGHYQSKTRPVYSNNQVIRNKSWQNDGSGPRAPRPDQQVYCEVCKISCVSQQAFDAHLKGQQHQKKEKMASASGNGDSKVGNQILNPVLMMCALCEVPCSGPEAYAAHMRGSKHQKVLSLHQRMGKPIPHMPPVPTTTVPADSSAGSLRVMGTPTMNFREGGCLSTTDKKDDANGSAAGSSDQTEADIAAIRSLDEVIAQAKNNSGTSSSGSAAVLRRPEPIGEDHVVSVSPRDGKPASFYCKICDCAIGDAVARDQHLRGKRHRYSYKQKVDPHIEAEVFPKPRPDGTDAAAKSGVSPTASSGSKAGNPSPAPMPGLRPVRPAQRAGPRAPGYGGNNWGYSGYSQNYGWNGPAARQPMPRYRPPAAAGGYMPRYPPQYSYAPMAPAYGSRQPFARMPGPMAGYRQPGYGYHPNPPAAHYPHRAPVRPFRGPPAAAPEPVYQPEAGPSERGLFPIPLTEDDHLILKKHSLICPAADELDFVFKLLNTVEEALKLVSDDLMVKQDKVYDPEATDMKVPARVLKGLMRVGPAAEQLLLAGDDEADVVVMCADKPTKSLQKQVMERLPIHLAKLSDPTHVTVGLEEDEYTIRVTDMMMMSGKGKKWSVRISLTSPLMRSVNQATPVAGKYCRN